MQGKDHGSLEFGKGKEGLKKTKKEGNSSNKRAAAEQLTQVLDARAPQQPRPKEDQTKIDNLVQGTTTASGGTGGHQTRNIKPKRRKNKNWKQT